jgi:hypothetical protein
MPESAACHINTAVLAALWRDVVHERYPALRPFAIFNENRYHS